MEEEGKRFLLFLAFPLGIRIEQFLWISFKIWGFSVNYYLRSQ